jgi:hypothetical protein
MSSITRRALLNSSAAALAAAAPERSALPGVAFGAHQVSRLIVGGNPVSGFSHVSPALDREMLDYFSAANIKSLLRASEQAGINTWMARGDRHVIRILREYRNEGGTIAWIAQSAPELSDFARNIREIKAAGAIGAYHHGGATDGMWAAGNVEALREKLKPLRDSGLRIGLGTHTPEVLDYVESKGWDLDFYTTCLYNLSRSRAEASKLAGRPVEGEFFHEPDREQMLKRVRQTTRQCLIFKVYGAGRRCTSEADMRAALRQVFEYAKPSDPLIVGLYPKHKDQVAENRRLLLDALGARPSGSSSGQ